MYEINDSVTIYDRLSGFDECSGLITEITDEGMYKVTFPDGDYCWTEGKYLELN